MGKFPRRFVLLAIAAGALGLGAQSAQAGVNAREARQRERIHAGVHDGSLTRGEAGRLGREQVRVERRERRFRRDDGQLDAGERARLQRSLSHSSRHIYGARHNDRTRE